MQMVLLFTAGIKIMVLVVFGLAPTDTGRDSECPPATVITISAIWKARSSVTYMEAS